MKFVYLVLGVSNGYINNDFATSKSFVENPFGEGLIYKTGDLGRFNSNNEIEYIGRSDNQIKIRGLRVELEEIEERILQIPSIKSCVVVKGGDSLSQEYLCAYFVASKPLNAFSIRKYLELYLPSYIIPQYFVQLDNIPYNNNGKIDRLNLPEPKKTHKARLVKPRNKIDEKLIAISKKILNLQSISINDRFLDIGFDSLSAINLCIKINSEFKTEILVSSILQNPTLRELSDIISNKINSAKLSVIPKIAKSDCYPVSSAQKRIYLSSKAAGSDSILYNTPGGIIFDGNIDRNKLENCIKLLINRHESFRTSFDVLNENIFQKISDSVPFKLDIVENADFNKIDFYFKNFVKPFNLQIAPLFRAEFIKFSNNKSVLFIDMHHIISDGRSMNIFADELCDLYNGKALSELEITYKDFSSYEIQEIKSGKFKEAENYWVNQFKLPIPVLNMPTSFQRPAVQSFIGAKIHSSIDSLNTKKIMQLAHNLDITPYMFLLAAYYVLLYKYTLQEDIIVGTPTIGRDIDSCYNLIGMFVNTLAIRETIDTNLSFKDFILAIKNHLLEAYKYQAFPFDELVNKLNIKRDISRNVLFDTMFIYQNAGYKDLHLNDVLADYYIPDTNISKFDLSLEAFPFNDIIKLSFEYNTSLFDKSFINSFSDHYLNILNVVLENINTKISDISMFSDEEQDELLNEFNNLDVDYPKDKTIVDLFEEQVLKTPNNIAISFENDTLTYSELNEKSNSLAHYLINHGIKKQDIIAIRITNSLETIIAMIAIIKAGCCYLPINTQYPKDRVEFMFKDSNAKLLLGDSISLNEFDFDIEKLDISLSREEIYNEDCNNLNFNISPLDLIYIIYTSGSTGTPKGAMLMHKNVVRLMKNDKFLFDFSDKDIWILLHSIAFDFSVWEIYGALLYGGKLVIASSRNINNPSLFLDLLEKEKVTILNQTPTYFYNLLNTEIRKPHLNLKIRYIIFGGEALKPNLIAPWHQLHPLTKLINMYGITETTVHVTFKEISNDDLNSTNSNIGFPIPTLKILLLDKNLKLVPHGVPGEICVCGDGIFKGYLNRPNLNSTKIIPNPYNTNELMYRSADSAVVLNNSLEYLGRIDTQVKIRGLRVELGEIENLLLKYPHISNAIVVKQTINEREFISAYFISNKRIIINDLRKYLSKTLPRYMVPTYFIALDKLPYTPNGKIDKNALPLPLEILNVSKEQYVSPKSDLQKKIVEIEEKILNTKPIGIKDNFFELGGDSLLAMNLNVELLKLSNKISYQDIFKYPTVAELEEKINSDNNAPMFSKIENLSEDNINVLKNSIKSKRIFKYHPKGILLTGSTGFLGIHVLEQFIKKEKGNIYCLIRKEPGITSKTKLYQKLNYYFGNKYDDLLDKRIFVLTGNITQPGFGLNQDELLNLASSIDVVINCAANVSHYGNYNNFYNTNVRSVRHMIDFCRSFHKKIYHISTISVSGTKMDSSFPSFKKNSKIKFNESCLYIGQVLENVYVRSKFEAESYMLDAIGRNLDGYIIRVGNLMPRYKDGVFQENSTDNAFISRLSTFMHIGIIPNYLLHKPIDLTPVDYAAKAIYKLVTNSNKSNRIFHIFNHNYVSAEKLLKVAKKANYNVDIVNEDTFKTKILKILESEDSKGLLNILSNDFNSDLHLDYKSDIIISSNFTVKYLIKNFFIWPRNSKKYLANLIKLLMEDK